MSTEVAETLSINHRAGRKIEFLSIAWTAIESIVGIIAGVLAGSVALISFGIDSVIEVASSLVLVWRLSDASATEDREAFAHRLVGACFLALAVYVSFEALKDLLTRSSPRVTYLGIIYAAACVIVMPMLARAKRRAAANLSAVAALPAVAFLAVIHGAIFAGLFAIRLVRCKTYGANRCRQN